MIEKWGRIGFYLFFRFIFIGVVSEPRNRLFRQMRRRVINTHRNFGLSVAFRRLFSKKKIIRFRNRVYPFLVPTKS